MNVVFSDIIESENGVEREEETAKDGNKTANNNSQNDGCHLFCVQLGKLVCVLCVRSEKCIYLRPSGISFQTFFQHKPTNNGE